jgi:hypothetical protein
LQRVEPTLKPGEREIIPNFHDESSFHANDEVRNLWLMLSEFLKKPILESRAFHTQK